MTDTDTLPMEHLEPDEGFMQPRRYKHRFRCVRCGHEYHKISTKVVVPDEPCPKIACQVAIEVERKMAADENVARMLEEQRPPGHLVQSNSTKAIDQTASMVMDSYGMTNLRDDIRQGESMAPPLPRRSETVGDMQAAADNYFSPWKAAEKAGGAQLERKVKMMGAQAIAGAYRSHAINPGRMNSKAGIVPGTPALRVVRKEPAR